jgi:predicted dehydrogenase
MDHFSECVVKDRTPRTHGEEGLTDVRVLAAIDKSIRTAKAASIIL